MYNVAISHGLLQQKIFQKISTKQQWRIRTLHYKRIPIKDKSQLYHQVLNWIISMSSNAQSAVQSCDENKGIILTRCYLPNIARRTMGDNSYRVSIRPLLRFDFKDGKIRFTYTLQNYEVLKTNDDSGYVILFGSFGVTGDGITQDSQIWNLKIVIHIMK